MSAVVDLYFPSADARELNGDLRKEHLVFLTDHPDWAPPELGWVPRSLVRFLNRLASRMPLTAHLGWIDGSTPADDGERQRINAMPEDEQAEARDLHLRAIYGRCFRIAKPLFTELKPPELSTGSDTK
jgi:hypothetical protein